MQIFFTFKRQYSNKKAIIRKNSKFICSCSTDVCDGMEPSLASIEVSKMFKKNKKLSSIS